MQSRRLAWVIALAVLATVAGAQQEVRYSLKHDAVAAVQPGDVIAIELQGAQGARATIQFEGQTREWLVEEAQPGVYRGDYTVRRDDQINGKRLFGVVRLADGSLIRLEAANKVGEPEPVLAPPTPDAPPPPVEITEVKVNAPEWIGMGQTAEVVVKATPGSQVEYVVSGYGEAEPMREGRPGEYHAQFLVPNLARAAKERLVIVRARKADNTALAVAAQPLNLDTLQPTILFVSPETGDKVPAGANVLRVAYDDFGGSDIDLTQSRLTLDGADLIASAAASGNMVEVTLEQPMTVGEHTFVVQLSDRTGNRSRTVTTRFEVVPEGGAVPLVVTHNAAQLPEPGTDLIVRLTGPEGGRAVFSVPDVVANRPMAEIDPGVYEGSYTVRRTDELGGKPVTVTFTNAAGQATEARAEANIAAAAPAAPGAPAALVAPVITSHTEGQRVGDEVVLAGTGTAGSTIELTVTGTGSALFILTIEIEPFEAQATVDAEGNWRTGTLPFRLPALAQRAEYTVTAVAVRGNERSAPTTLKLSR